MPGGKKDLSLDEELEFIIFGLKTKQKYREIIRIAETILRISPGYKYAIRWKLEAMYYMWLKGTDNMRLLTDIIGFIKDSSWDDSCEGGLKSYFGEVLFSIARKISKGISSSDKMVLKMREMAYKLIKNGVNAEDDMIYEGSVYVDHESDVISMAISGDGSCVVTSSDDRTVKVWDVKSWKLIEKYDIKNDVVEKLCLTPDSRYIVGGTLGLLEDGKIYRWERNKGGQKIYRGYYGGLRDIAISENGKYIYGCGHARDIRDYDCTIRVWREGSEKELKILNSEGALVMTIDVSADGKYLVNGTSDGYVELWDVERGKKIVTYVDDELGSESVMAVKITPNGRYIASCMDNYVYLWEAPKAGEELGIVDSPTNIFQEHKSIVNTVEITPDGSYVISGSDDNTIRIWRRGYKRPYFTITTHSNGINEVKRSADGRYLATREYNSPVIKIWALYKLIF